MTTDARALRGLADARRRAADRLTLLRLRLANGLGDLTRSEDPGTRSLGEDLHERWTGRGDAPLGRVAAALRAQARRLDEAATAAERTTGRRLGGYTGAGFLGRGDEAHRHVDEVAQFVGTAHGASIGGYPLTPTGPESVLPHPSHTLGLDTPPYEEADEADEGR